MSVRDRSRKVASVEDADESGNIIEGTGRYAESVASPIKEKPNTGRARKEKAGRNTPSPLHAGLTDSDSTLHPRKSTKSEPRPRLSRDTRDRKDTVGSSKRTTKQAVVAMRPAPPRQVTTPNLGSGRRSEDPSYYGVPATVTPASSHPRPQPARQSYYALGRPPPSNSRFYNAHPPTLNGPHFPPYSPQPWTSPGPQAFPAHSPLGSQAPDYFSPRQQSLVSRFSRPQSAIGFRPPPAIGYDHDKDSEEEFGAANRTLVRRPSASRKPKIDESRRPIPPPQRPASARPTLGFRPPNTPAQRRSVTFEDEEFDEEPRNFRDSLSRVAYDYPSTMLPRSRRPSIGTPSTSYDSGPYRTEIASSRPNRRHSYFAGQSASSGSAYEDKMRMAAAYQDDVGGGPTMPLTAESLRKAGKNGGSSRSTRSSGSAEGSEYRRSATTRTTRSSGNGNEEDVTIKVKGQAYLKVGGAEMRCQEGAEINISRGGDRPDGESFAEPEDRSEGRRREDRRLQERRDRQERRDERRSRIDRPASRARASSQAAPYPPRTMQRYDVPSSRYEGYPYPPSTSPFSAYPRQDGGFF